MAARWRPPLPFAAERRSVFVFVFDDSRADSMQRRPLANRPLRRLASRHPNPSGLYAPTPRDPDPTAPAERSSRRWEIGKRRLASRRPHSSGLHLGTPIRPLQLSGRLEDGLATWPNYTQLFSLKATRCRRAAPEASGVLNGELYCIYCYIFRTDGSGFIVWDCWDVGDIVGTVQARTVPTISPSQYRQPRYAAYRQPRYAGSPFSH